MTGVFREVFRYKKADRVRIYHLSSSDDEEAELWVVTAAGKSRRLTTLKASDDEALFLQDVQRQLREGGWRQV